ncbi:MAG: hypothetical protein P8N76_24840 [Pirellulaceae bacterium]|nr:hypothetical protein [Pirellulaceae bacterium]
MSRSMSAIKKIELLFAGRLFVALICQSALPAAEEAAISIHPQVNLSFADRQTAKQSLGQTDRFIRNLSPFDRQIRLQASDPISEAQFLDFVQAQALDWTLAEESQLRQVLKELQPLLLGFKKVWPPEIQLLLTTGREEANAPHCREAAIVLPRSVLKRDSASLKRLVLHELFHVLSRHSPLLRRQLYAVVGFREVKPIDLPRALINRKITNPDAPLLNCVIQLDRKGQQVDVTPVLLTKAADYETFENRTLFGELLFRLMEVEESEGSWRPQLTDGQANLIDPRSEPSYHKQIGRNTEYIIHPEEVLADNFVHMLMKSSNLPNPEIVERMRTILLTEPDN